MPLGPDVANGLVTIEVNGRKDWTIPGDAGLVASPGSIVKVPLEVAQEIDEDTINLYGLRLVSTLGLREDLSEPLAGLNQASNEQVHRSVNDPTSHNGIRDSAELPVH
jgi:hypothetical protein